MASFDPLKTPNRVGEIVSNPGTPSDLLDGSNGGLLIPIPDDSGFYGYNDEKHLQHVSVLPHFPHRPKPTSSTQMGEKLFVQRRGSTNSDGGKTTFKSGLTMTSVTSVIEPSVLTMAPSPFMEEELKPEIEAPGRQIVPLGSKILGAEDFRYKPVHPRIPPHFPII